MSTVNEQNFWNDSWPLQFMLIVLFEHIVEK